MNRWLLIRGLARSTKHWGEFLEIFKKKFPQDEIECLDIRGNGELVAFPSYTSTEENVRDLRSRSQLLKKGQINILSISLGSMIAIEWSRLFPWDLNSLTIMNTSASNINPFYQRLNLQSLRNWKLYSDAILKSKDPLEKEKAILKFVAQNLVNSDQIAAEFAKIPATTHANLIRQLMAASTFQINEKPKMPLLILGSKEDKMVSPECTRAIAETWTHPVVWHPSAGHEITLEDPHWVSDQIHDFIKSLDSPKQELE